MAPILPNVRPVSAFMHRGPHTVASTAAATAKPRVPGTTVAPFSISGTASQRWQVLQEPGRVDFSKHKAQLNAAIERGDAEGVLHVSLMLNALVNSQNLARNELQDKADSFLLAVGKPDLLKAAHAEYERLVSFYDRVSSDFTSQNASTYRGVLQAFVSFFETTLGIKISGPPSAAASKVDLGELKGEFDDLLMRVEFQRDISEAVVTDHTVSTHHSVSKSSAAPAA